VDYLVSRVSNSNIRNLGASKSKEKEHERPYELSHERYSMVLRITMHKLRPLESDWHRPILFMLLMQAMPDLSSLEMMRIMATMATICGRVV